MKAGHWYEHMDYHQQTGAVGDTSTVGVYTAHFHGETQKYDKYQEQTKQINGN